MAVGHRGYLVLKAERTGFEPANRFCRLHAFQACLFNHSSTSPLIDFFLCCNPLFVNCGAKVLLLFEKNDKTDIYLILVNF